MLKAIKSAALSAPFSAFDVVELEGTIIDRFQLVVQRRSSHVAINHKGQTITYQELDARSNLLAHFLLTTLGSVKEPVALIFRHGIDHHVCQLAILKAGKFYSNIDPDLRLEKSELVLSNLGARYLLHDGLSETTASALSGRLPELNLLNFETLDIDNFSSELPTPGIGPGDYASIVYTSGSTGLAQGVILTHQNLLHLARSHGQDIRLSSEDRTTQICALWTGASAAEIYCSLLNEATLYPCSLQHDGVKYFLKLLEDAAITTMVAAPTLFRALLEGANQEYKFAAMRVIRLGGDRVGRLDLAAFQTHFTENCSLRIAYGASEFIPASRFYVDVRYLAQDRVPIGYAMEGCEIDILNGTGHSLGANEIGEIAVSSAYLSPGYWQNPQLTAERFIKRSNEGKRYFLTHDLGYKDVDGCLFHLGRTDSRVKIYGKMVLTTNIEQSILRITGVSAVVVIPLENTRTTNIELAAFVVCNSMSLNEVAIRKDLLKTLAPEVIPRRFVILPEFPMLSNSKIDRVKLRQMARSLNIDKN